MRRVNQKETVYLRYTPEQDRRRKLSDIQKEAIRERYALGGVSWMDLAREYGVSKKLIGLIVSPEMKAKNEEAAKQNWKKYQATKEERAAVMREFRARKFALGLARYVKAGEVYDAENPPV